MLLVIKKSHTTCLQGMDKVLLGIFAKFMVDQVFLQIEWLAQHQGKQSITTNWFVYRSEDKNIS